jgi:hypothetical protein
MRQLFPTMKKDQMRNHFSSIDANKDNYITLGIVASYFTAVIFSSQIVR